MTQAESNQANTGSQDCSIAEARPGNAFLLILWSSAMMTGWRVGPLQLSQAQRSSGPRQDDSCLPAYLLACQAANPI